MQVPFVVGGAELHVRGLVEQLQRRGHDAERVAVPFKPHPRSELLSQAAAWRLLDLSSSNGQAIDLLIATRFPSYFARHPRKVAWVIHQHRAAYDLCGTPFSDFTDSEEDVGIRRRLLELDREMLLECRRVFTNARNTADRLAKYNGIEGQPLYHPPPLAGSLHAGPYGDYVLAVGRLEKVKRMDLAIRALALTVSKTRLVIVGDGSQRATLEALARETGVASRIVFAGSSDGDALVEFYAGALGVIYTPFDEDFGYVTLEAFLAKKPVITATDSGGPLEFVVDGTSGCICDPAPAAIAQQIDRLAADRALAARLGEAGYERARLVSWDGVVEALLG